MPPELECQPALLAALQELPVAALRSEQHTVMTGDCSPGWSRWGGGARGPRNLLDRRAWRLLPSGFLVLQPSTAAEPGAAPDLAQVYLQACSPSSRRLPACTCRFAARS